MIYLGKFSCVPAVLIGRNRLFTLRVIVGCKGNCLVKQSRKLAKRDPAGHLPCAITARARLVLVIHFSLVVRGLTFENVGLAVTVLTAVYDLCFLLHSYLLLNRKSPGSTGQHKQVYLVVANTGFLYTSAYSGSGRENRIRTPRYAPG